MYKSIKSNLIHYKNIKYLLLLFLVCNFFAISRFHVLQLFTILLSSQPLLTSLSYLAISIEMRQHICFNKTLKIWDVTYTKMHFFIQHEKNISTNHMMGIFYTTTWVACVIVLVRTQRLVWNSNLPKLSIELPEPQYSLQNS